MIVARFNDTDYCLLNRPTISTSSRETKFSDIQIDFRDKVVADLPVKYQEVKILEDSTVIFYGYVDSFALPKFVSSETPAILSISLLTPQTYFSKRTVSKTITNLTVKAGVVSILADLVSKDGFTIEYNDLPENLSFSKIYSSQIVEKALDELANRFSFTYYVDELKKIYLRTIDGIIASEAVLDISGTIEESGIEYLIPKFEAVDYTNKLSLNNFYLINDGNPNYFISELTQGESYKFNTPVTISNNAVSRVKNSDLALRFEVLEGGFTPKNYTLSFSTGVIVFPADIGILGVDDEDAAKLILLEKSQNNDNTIVGFKYRGPDGILELLYSACVLEKFKATYIDPVEIEANKGVLNTSGIVESSVQMYGKYFTVAELTEYAKSLLSQNNRQNNIVEIGLKGNSDNASFTTLKNKIKLTNKITIDLPQFFINAGSYIITDIEYMNNGGVESLRIETRSSNLKENYIDIFRKPDVEVDENDIKNIMQVLYSQDEKTVLSQNVLVDGVEVNV